MHRGIKIDALKMQFVCIFFQYLLKVCRKFEFLIFQGSVATYAKVRWTMSYGFCSKFYLRVDKVTESLEVRTFLRHNIHKRASALQTIRGLLHRLKII